MEPTIGLSITDLGSTDFKEFKVGSSEPLDKPDLILPSVNLGMSLKPIKAKRHYLLTAVDMHSINQPYLFSQKLQFGIEYGYGGFFVKSPRRSI